ncbi:MAG TPA: RDD family protein [Accumulibacter sp.]|nr:RDD family protein [Accumulibacter sp.]HMW17364.1 RDD family protein [Accumulibacter sp.]HMX23479.1 RDD family protein [Accumulibacter sp.]HMY07067.1 RDD family protein [Accumulibacter sp.]HNC17131.1 RDD family protein [Accumulibacter sp.]
MSGPPPSRLDTVCRIATPEGCEIDLRVAGPVARARAWFLDFLIRMGCWMLLGIIASQIGEFGVGLMLLGAFLLEWFYPLLFEIYRQGQTPGKKSCGLAVVHDDGRPVGWHAAFVRNTLRAVDFLPLLYAAGFVSTLFNRQGKRLGDLAAGTLVVHLSRPPRDEPVADDVGSEPPPFALTRDEQLAVIEFSQRAPLLTPERAAEVASVAGPLTAGLSGEAAERRLRRIGNFLLGNRS